MYRIEEFPEVWADACLRDSEGRFMFLSLYGRDGSLMQLLAAMDLGPAERGVQRFHLVDQDDTRRLSTRALPPRAWSPRRSGPGSVSTLVIDASPPSWTISIDP